MNTRLSALAQSIRQFIGRSFAGIGMRSAGVLAAGGQVVRKRRAGLLLLAALTATAVGIWTHPVVQTIERGDVGVRTNELTGDASEFAAGTVFVFPGLQELRRFSLRDQVYKPGGDAPFQSVEGLSIGVDMTVRYALDPAQVRAMSRTLPKDIGGEIVQPAVQSVIYRVFTRYTVREIFSSRRAEIQQAIESELRPKLATDGIVLRGVQIGKVALPEEYRRGMDQLLAEELLSEKMRYTLELKDKKIQESALDAEADKVRREKAAEAAGREQVIAAQAQEEAMKHVLPFKQKQIEQRQLEAEAEKVSRIKTAEGTAQARRIEASGEADSRQKLADAEVYRLDRVGKVNSEQMAREGELITRHPLLIQKALADKLSDKIQVIIASPGAGGGFIGAGLIGTPKTLHAAANAADAEGNDAAEAP
jgi:regulator of protease activity HflC (stomatin/prohibitin superfamily)